jgi:hypothetical protein
MALKVLVNHAIGGDVTARYVVMSLDRLREPAQRVADRLKELCGIARHRSDQMTHGSQTLASDPSNAYV